MGTPTATVKPETRAPLNFKKMYDDLIPIPASDDGISSRRRRKRGGAYDADMVQFILSSGNDKEIAALSNDFFATNSIYKQTIIYISSLLLYYTVVVPIFNTDNYEEELIKKRFSEALKFVDRLDISLNFQRVMEKTLINGVYYGLLRDYGKDGATIQDLPYNYCRTRFKNQHNLNVLEFNLTYFDSVRFSPGSSIQDTLESFPEEIQQAYYEYLNDPASTSQWYEVDSSIGIAFYFYDKTPLFAAAIPSMMKYEGSQDREAIRDLQELQKILIQKLPIGKNDELILSLDEAQEMHNGIATMIKNNPYLQLITSPAEIKLEEAQSTNAATSADRIEKYEKAMYTELGISQELFNATGNTAVNFSINRNTALAVAMSEEYSAWLSYQLNRKFGMSNLSFNIEILPITFFNKKDLAAQYITAAQYGYSRMYAGVAQGIKQSNMISLITLENDILNLDEIMIPLQSSFTSSGAPGEGSSATNPTGAGRPALSTEDKTSKTIANTGG